jgi:hypothetical protein
MVNIFISHTQKDKKFCDEFDTIVARVGIPAFRSEYEAIEPPPWKEITNKIDQSVAVFLLVGQELVNSQESGDRDWRYTQNWIAYEIGVASRAGKDVWVICDNVVINFPVPYINNYMNTRLPESVYFGYLRMILEDYQNGVRFRYPYTNPQTNEYLGVVCPNGKCRLEFNLHNVLLPGQVINCPSCLKQIKFKVEHLMPPS